MVPQHHQEGTSQERKASEEFSEDRTVSAVAGTGGNELLKMKKTPEQRTSGLTAGLTTTAGRPSRYSLATMILPPRNVSRQR